MCGRCECVHRGEALWGLGGVERTHGYAGTCSRGFGTCCDTDTSYEFCVHILRTRVDFCRVDANFWALWCTPGRGPQKCARRTDWCLYLLVARSDGCATWMNSKTAAHGSRASCSIKRRELIPRGWVDARAGSAPCVAMGG